MDLVDWPAMGHPTGSLVVGLAVGLNVGIAVGLNVGLVVHLVDKSAVGLPTVNLAMNLTTMGLCNLVSRSC